MSKTIYRLTFSEAEGGRNEKLLEGTPADIFRHIASCAELYGWTQIEVKDLGSSYKCQ